MFPFCLCSGEVLPNFSGSAGSLVCPAEASLPKNPEGLGVILEFKKAKENDDLKELALSAIEQIVQLDYVTELKSRGIKKILALGMAFQGKLVSIQDKFLS